MKIKEESLEKLKPFLASIKPIDIQPTDATPSVLPKGNKFKAVIFDIYGTLIISASGDIMQSSYNAGMFQEALEIAGYEILVPVTDLMKIHPIFEEEVLSGKKSAKESGIPFPELNIVEVWKNTLQKSEEKGLIKITSESDVHLYTFVFELKSNQVWPMPGLKEMLAELKQRKMPLGIVSNAQFYTPIIMNYFLYGAIKPDEFLDGFEKDLSVFSYKMLKGKPDTAVYEALLAPLKKRGWHPEDVLYVGNDMLKDIYASSQVGFKTCFYAGDMRAYRLREDHPEASKTKPDFIITELNQLLDIL